jgi:acetylornithine deacetylase/succinyl-diaminopimelate desuccinylase-like protein
MARQALFPRAVNLALAALLSIAPAASPQTLRPPLLLEAAPMARLAPASLLAPASAGLSLPIPVKPPAPRGAAISRGRPSFPAARGLRVLAASIRKGSRPALSAAFDNAAAPGASGPSLSPELVEFLRELVRAPSVNGVHTEDGAARALERFALGHGIRVRRFEAVPGRPALELSVGPREVPGLVLVAHMDTVPAGEEKLWRHPPFGAEIENGRLYGRGACDDKGGLVAAVGALLKAKSRNPKRSLTLLAVPDEESGATGKLGIRLLREKGELRGLGAIYAYPGLGRLQIGHRGVWRFEVSVEGDAVHTGSRKWQKRQARGANALAGAAEIILGIEALSKRLSGIPGSGLFSKYSTVLTPAEARGGSSYGMAPDIVRVKVDCRLVPGVPVEGVRSEVEALLSEVRRGRPDLKISRREESFLPPSQADPEAKVVSAVQGAARAVLGRELPLGVSGPANESYLLNAFGIPTVVIGPEGRGAHSADEWVDLDSVETASRLYAEAWERLSPD